LANQLREIPEEEKKLGPYFSLAWAIGNALSIVGAKGFERQIIELCRNPKYGAARQMVVLGLGRLRSSEAEEMALGLFSDEQVQIHAVIALGKMKVNSIHLTSKEFETCRKMTMIVTPTEAPLREHPKVIIS